MAKKKRRMKTNLGLAGRVAAQAIEDSRLNDRLASKSAGAEGRGAKSERGSHIGSNNLMWS